eukprot:TRINITY_DN4866_c0_g1_i1.p1 TRINITY_DN4866_c0_g1~~TRINITY_DN4866_c0_g1_i1.p1  ORF type:complete len:354 (+),score=148.09 TRINITY_DN4866_c0_g1_i1:90-1064(+)
MGPLHGAALLLAAVALPAPADAAGLSDGVGGPGGRAKMQHMPASDAAFTGGHGELKELSLTEARELLAKLLAVVRDKGTQQRLAEALQQAARDPRQEKMRKAFGAKIGPREKAELRMAAIGPVLEELTAPILAKEGGFKGGFMEAVLSIERAGQSHGDQRIERDMAYIRELATGEKYDPTGSIGKIREFDVLANGFAELDEGAMDDRMHEAEKLLNKLTVDGKLTKPLAKLYVDTMKQLAAGGDKGKGALEEEIVTVVSRVRGSEEVPKKERNKLMKRVNILSAFFSPKENGRIAQRILEKTKKQKPEPEEGEGDEDFQPDDEL